MTTILNKFELNTIYAFPAKGFGAGQYLTAEGVAYVRKWIRKNVGVNVTTTVIQEQIGVEHTLQSKDSLIVTKGFGTFKNAGKFPVRVKKWAYETQGVTLDPLILSQLGSSLENHFIGGRELYFDLYPTIDWDSGVFGEKSDEGGSCWWTQGWVRRVRRYMPDEMIALRVFKKLSPKDGDYDGPVFYGEYAPVGRCWAFTPAALGVDLVVFFNAYGPNLLHLAAQFAQTAFGNVEGSYKQIGLSSNPLPINSNLGIAVGDPALLETVDRIRIDNWVDERCEVCAQQGVRRVGEYRADFSARETHHFCSTHFNTLVIQTFEGFFAWRSDCEEILTWLSEFHSRRQTIWVRKDQLDRYPVCPVCNYRYAASVMKQCPCQKAKQTKEGLSKVKFVIMDDAPKDTNTPQSYTPIPADYTSYEQYISALHTRLFPSEQPSEINEETFVGQDRWQFTLLNGSIDDVDIAIRNHIREHPLERADDDELEN